MKVKLEYNIYLEDSETLNKNHFSNWVQDATQNRCDSIHIIIGNGVNAKEITFSLGDAIV